MSDIQKIISSLHLQEGDIILADVNSVDIAAMMKIKSPTKYMHWILEVRPQPGMNLEDCIRTCRIEDLKRIIADMEAHV